MTINIHSSILTISPNDFTINEIVDILENFKINILSIQTKKNETTIKIDKKIEKNRELFEKIIKLALLKKISKHCKFYYFFWHGYSLKQIEYLRALALYESQIIRYSYDFIVNTFLKYPQIINDLLLKNETDFKTDNESEERVLNIFKHIVKNIEKTNLSLNKETISFKVNVKNFKHLLNGINPNIESFVYHNNFIGVHLRMSKISRGGIRHSNRIDFREEIKDLMTTQQYKNAIIIPDGAKGGFFIFKKDPTKVEIKQYYSLYIDALLDLIDFEVDENKDFYFVVAADKGTSDFSDIANEIAIKREYFFKDAFASGGKNGYSHKKLGITARGALTAANIHFEEKNKNIFKDAISVVGVGSMRGDVFGNAMLMNKNFKLIAAISSNEIFIDPNPDIQKSYLERKRLFENSLSWKDFNKNIISKGGGVFDRKQKKIKLTEEIKKLIKTDLDTISPNELIKKLLTLDTELLYFGAIGTYVKASDEINELISDKSNADIRINAKDLNAYAICEGANLALTNKARTEYAINGGKINVDAIDNSAGVNISDYEVNLKLGGYESKLLKKVTNEVIQKVLTQNRLQPLRITLDSTLSQKEIKEFADILKQNETFEEVFNSFDSSLPIRPILSILLLYTKIFVKKHIDFLSEKAYKEYFPKAYVPVEHILKKEISKTVITNKIVNLYGIKILKKFSKQKIINLLNLIDILNLEKIQDEILNQDFKYKIKYFKILDEIIELNISTPIETTQKPLINNLNELIKNQNKLKFIALFINISHKTGLSLEKIYKIYSQINSIVKLEKILNHIKNIKINSQLEEKMKFQTYKNFECFLKNTIEYSIYSNLKPKEFLTSQNIEKHKTIFYYNYLSNEMLLNSFF